MAVGQFGDLAGAPKLPSELLGGQVHDGWASVWTCARIPRVLKVPDQAFHLLEREHLAGFHCASLADLTDQALFEMSLDRRRAFANDSHIGQ